MAWLIARYKHMVHTAAYRVTRNREDAEEVAQDSFVKALRNLQGFTGGSRFSTWLFSITYRTAISHLRKRREGADTLGDQGDSETGAWDTATAERDDRKQALERALGHLSQEDASIVSFFYLDELSVEEIVTVTGLSASNVKVRLHRSRKKLMGALKEHLKDEVWTLIVN